MTAPLPLGLRNPYSNLVPCPERCACDLCMAAIHWRLGALAVIARLETMRRDQCAAMCIGAAIQKLERELKGET